jgi:GR25 family glycosyltransferase involved in LPS biosynthesis
MELAPIVLFVYNRPWHTQQTLNALGDNELASQSILYVFADGPKKDASDENLEKIRLTREIAKNFTSCKEVIFEESRDNIGCADSITSGITRIVNKHGKIIVLEDDIVTGKGFLTYMNEAFDLYQNEERVISVTAFNYPIKFKNVADTYFLKGADSWGWGTWKRGWDQFNPDASVLLNEIKRRKLSSKFNLGNTYNFVSLLELQIEGKIDAWDIQFHAGAFLNNKLTLHPKVSLVKNIGLDGSGTHCHVVNDEGIYTDHCKVYPVPVKESKTALRYLKEYYKPGIMNRIVEKLKRWKKAITT